jgi:2-oxoglutarate dehydrogenase E1 component
VVNNQVGFTTSPKDSRSTPYCTDIGRMFHIPIFHVNGEDPEAVVHVTRLATEWRMTWKTDVIIDMYCFRKHGHNEGDEPTYTQPEMYRVVATKKPVRELYASALATRGSVTAQRAEGIRAEKRGALEAGLTTARKPDFEHEGINSMRGLWSRFKGGRDGDIPQVDTAITLQRAQTLLAKVGSYPSGFAAHPKLVPIMKGRQDMAEGKRPLDWGAAEALAFASLVTDGYLVRVSGQDSGRGTFAHRHSVLRSTTNGAEYVPLNHLSPEQAPYQVFDSPLSEAGVLGFEYGYSLDYPDALVIWEAQFGDFVNGAQVIIDQFMSSAEAKWNRLSGLCLFLPHGYEGQGPEHSSARMDRFLGLCAGDNMQVCNVTQPAQLFHLLRRQVLRAFRKPLVLFTPKSLLRHKSVVSDLPAFTTGGFQSILSDTTVDPANVRRVLLCSGKVYYDLEAARAEKN